MTEHNPKIEKAPESAIEEIKRAREAKAQMAALGIDSASPAKEAVETRTFETFKELTGLPSRGMFYESGISGQALKTEDILILSDFDESNAQKVFNEVFARRIKGVSPRDILMADELYLGFWLRESAFPKLEFPGEPFTCMHEACGYKNPAATSSFVFSDIDFNIEKFNEIAAMFKAGNGKISITLPISKKEMFISLRKRGSIERYNDYLKREYTQFNTTPDKLVLKILPIATVVNVGMGDLKVIIEEIKSLDPMDSVYLMKKVTEYSLVPDVTIRYKCIKCQGVTPVNGYTFLPGVFLPVDFL